ncbi:MAG TPA: type VI secretion system baseplate subunit TssG [Flavisolibacter sp.]
MKPESFTPSIFGELEKDFKAEVTAAEMIELGIPPDQIVIMPLGAMKRSLRKDVQSIEEELPEQGHADYIVVKTPKEGFYDMLPEGLFHSPPVHLSSNTVKEICKAIKSRKEEELKARRFFLPFEATINHLRMQVALYENRLDKRIHYDELVGIFTGYSPMFEHLDARQSDLFLHLLPILHDIRDDHPVVEKIMEMMLELPVQVRLREQLRAQAAEPILSMLGDSSLGVNFTTGNEWYSEGVDEISIKIGPVSGELFQQFTPGGAKQRLLEALIDHLLPAHLDIAVEFELHGKDRRVRLADKETYLNSVLGTDTYL